MAQVHRLDLIGMIVPLSGFVADYGTAVRNGVQMYVADNPDKCDGVTFSWEDSRYSGTETTTAFRKFKEQNAMLVYVWGSAPAEVAVPLAENASMPLFVLAESTTVAGKSYAFNMTSPSWEFSRYVLEELRKRGKNNLAIVKAEYVYFERIVEGFKQFLQPHEALHEIASVQPDVKDFRSTVVKLRNSDFDAIGVLLDPAQGSAFFKQMAEQKLHLQAFGSTNFGSSRVITDAQGTMDGAVFSDTAVSSDFREKYVRKYGDASYVSTAAQSYDMTHIICGIDRGSRAQQVITSVLKMPPFSGVSGQVRREGTFESGRYFRFPVAVSEIRNGQPETISVDGKPVRVLN